MVETENNKIAIFLYCFNTGPDTPSIFNPDKLDKDSPGQRVVKTIWKEDGAITCPRCGEKLWFDGDIFYKECGGASFNIDDKKEISGHLFRYDLKTDGYQSPRYTPPIPGENKIFDFQEEFEYIKNRC